MNPSLTLHRSVLLSALTLVATATLADPSWKRPQADASWYWQLDNSNNVDLPFSVFDISLYDVPATYIRQLKAQEHYVICYFSAGTSEDYNPDRAAFKSADLGKAMSGYPKELWLNINSTDVRSVLAKRLDHAHSAGCDAVEPDNVNFQGADTGFSISLQQQTAFLIWLAQQAHERGLAIGLKNDLEQAATLEPLFDFAVNEQCFQYQECDALKVFIKAGKPVFHAEYAKKYREDENAREQLCAKARALGFSTLVLNPELDGSYFYSCELMSLD